MEQMLKCRICLKEVTEHRQLQCHHVFCLHCLVAYVECKGKKDTLECPYCGKVCSLPDGDVKHLSVSLLFNQIKKVKNNYHMNHSQTYDSITCCLAECCEQAVVFCTICKYICSTCATRHKSVTDLKDHKMLSIDEGKNYQKYNSPLCPTHSDRPLALNMYCNDCEMSICSKCYSESHMQHTFNYHLSEIELEAIIKKMRYMVAKSQEHTGVIDDHSNKLKTSADETKKKVAEKVCRINEEVLFRRHELERAVSESYEEGKRQLEQTAKKTHKLHMDLGTLIFYSNQLLIYGTPCDRTAHTKAIKNKLHDALPYDPTLSLQELHSAAIDKKLHDFKVICIDYIVV